MSAIKDIDQVYEELKKDDVDLNTMYSYSHVKKTSGKSKNMYLGRIWWNLLLPDNHKLINEPVDGKLANNIIKDIINKYNPDVITNTINNITKHTFKLATINPISFTSDSFIIPNSIKRKKEKLLTSDLTADEFTQRLIQLGEEFLVHLKKVNDPIYDIIASGAKSNPLEFATLTLAKGITVDIEGNVFKPTLNSVNDGFTLEEFYQNAAEARSSLFEVSVGSAEPGTLAGSVAFANSNTKITGNDCKTKKYLDIFITPTIFSKILGRYYLNERSNNIKEIDEDSKIENKKIKLRSPLFCKQKDGICKVCFGKLIDKLNTDHVGLLASTVINKKGLSASLAAKHSVSSAKLKDVNFIKDLIKI